MTGYVPDLAPRLADTLLLVAAGRTSREIGVALGISRHSADTYVKQLIRDLGARNRPNAVHIAHGLGLLGGGR